MQKACSPKCALMLVEDKKAKDHRKEIREKKKKLKTRAQHLREAQIAFNDFIRERDKDQPCISCGRFHKGQWHAGHFYSVGAHPDLRFNEDNVHRQCQPCNTHLSGNIHNYRKNLPDRIGQKAFDVLDRVDSNFKPLKLTIEQIQGIKAEYRKKLRDLKKKTCAA